MYGMSGGSPAATNPEPSNGDVLDVLVGNHRRFLAFLERRLGGDRALAEDVLQSAYVRGIERAEQVRDPDGAVAWFYRLLRNALADHGRRAVAAAALERRLADESDDSEAEELERELCRCVDALAATLRPEYAAVLRRVEVDGLSLREFAAEAGITPNNAAVRVHRARNSLRARLAASCGTCADHGCLDCTCGAPGGPRGAISNPGGG